MKLATNREQYVGSGTTTDCFNGTWLTDLPFDRHHLTYPTTDGHTEIEGWDLAPRDGTGPHPMVLHIHGGPFAAHGEIFNVDNLSLVPRPLDTSATGGHIAGPNFPGVQAFPVVDLNGPLDGRDNLASFIAGGGVVNIFSSTATTTDFDSPNLTQSTITIGNCLTARMRPWRAVATTGTSITASQRSGTFYLSAARRQPDDQQVLRTVTYNNAAVHAQPHNPHARPRRLAMA